VDEVKGIMSDNIEKVLARGEKLELLVDKTDNLMFEVSQYPRQTDRRSCTNTPVGMTDVHHDTGRATPCMGARGWVSYLR
jgi:hypothetical protein